MREVKKKLRRNRKDIQIYPIKQQVNENLYPTKVLQEAEQRENSRNVFAIRWILQSRFFTDNLRRRLSSVP